MTAVLWVLAVPSLGVGAAPAAAADWFDGRASPRPSPPPSSAPVSPSSAARHLRTWRHSRWRRDPPRCVAALRRPRVEAASPTRPGAATPRARPGDPAGSARPAAPPRARLPPRRRLRRPVRPPGPGRRPRSSASSTARSSTTVRTRRGHRARRLARHGRPPRPDRQRADLPQRAARRRRRPGGRRRPRRHAERERVIDISESVMQFLLAFIVVGPLVGAAAALLPAPPGLQGQSPGPGRAPARRDRHRRGPRRRDRPRARLRPRPPVEDAGQTDISWIPALDVRIHLGIDGISLPLLVLTALLTFLCALYSYFKMPDGPDPEGLRRTAARPRVRHPRAPSPSSTCCCSSWPSRWSSSRCTSSSPAGAVRAAAGRRLEVHPLHAARLRRHAARPAPDRAQGRHVRHGGTRH